MTIFKKAVKEATKLDAAIAEVSKPKEEEWIWVEGYKGTNKDMKCLDYQYELGVQHDIPNEQKIEMCKSGFHLCLTLKDVFEYYPIGNNHRFFKVKALVHKSDKDKYGYYIGNRDYYYTTPGQHNKLVAKSIIFQSELTIDEIFADTEMKDWPMQYKQIAIELGEYSAEENYHIDTLVEDGYSKPFAAHIVKADKFDIAHAFGSQKDLSMDMKVLGILYNT